MNDDRKRRRRDEERFIHDVMARTSGSACGRAADRLPDLTDGALPDPDGQLVQAHLVHCAGCRNLAVTLAWLGPELEKMARLEPGPGFTARVLQKTILAAPGLAAGPVTEPGGFGPAGWMDRIGRWWQEQVMRPVFPLQAAYVATVFVVLLVATPLSPFRGAPARLLETVQAGPASTPILGPALSTASDAAGAWISDRGGHAVNITRGRVVALGRSVQTDLDERMERTAEPRGRMNRALSDLGVALSERDAGGAGYELHRLMKSGRQAWRLWWNETTTLDQS